MLILPTIEDYTQYSFLRDEQPRFGHVSDKGPPQILTLTTDDSVQVGCSHESEARFSTTLNDTKYLIAMLYSVDIGLTFA